MRIAYVVNQYPKVSHSFIRREIRALEETGCAVTRISMRGRREELKDPDDLAEADRTTQVLEAPGALLGATLAEAAARPGAFLSALGLALRTGWGAERGPLVHLVYLAEACRVARLCREAGVEHLHAHFGTNSATVAMLAAELAGLPWSFTVHGPEEFDRPQRLKLGAKAARAAFVAAISSYGRSQLYRWAALEDWPKIGVVRCGLDLARFAPAGEAGLASKKLVCVGRLCEQKGQLLLLDAVAAVAAEHPGLRLTLVGDGEMRPEVEARIAALGLGEVVEITGWAGEDEVRRHVSEARALVLASFAEGLPVVIMEALAMERPVVSTYIAGIPELVDADCGWLVPAGDAGALAEALRAALSAPPERLAEMGRAGRARVEARHDQKAEAAALLRLMREAAESEAGGRDVTPSR